MKQKILILIAVIAVCMLAITACGTCEHPEEARGYRHNGGLFRHNVYCTDCGSDIYEEACETADANAVCSKCGHVHGYVYPPDGETTEETHTAVCGECKHMKTEEHKLIILSRGAEGATYHDIDMGCTICGYDLTEIGDHSSASDEYKTSATSHWKICDICGREFEYEIHELVDGACTECGYAADSLPVSENLTFELSSDESYYILTRIECEQNAYMDIIIPDTYNGKPVRMIGDGGWNSFDVNSIKAVYIPDGVTVINDNAFDFRGYYPSIVYVRFPETLTAIGARAFENCKLSEVTIPGGVNNIGNLAFADNHELRTLVIEEGVNGIGDEAFQLCNMLTSVTLPSTINDISPSAFAGCDNIESLTLRTWNDKTEEYESGNYWYSVDDNCLVERKTMTLIRSNSSMTIPAGVKSITNLALSGDGNFYGNENKTYSIVLPKTLETIEEGALSYFAITDVSFDGVNSIYATGSGYLYEKESERLIWGSALCVIPESVTSIANDAFDGIKFDSFTIPANIKNMENGAFANCTFVNLTIEDGVGGIDFSGCTTEQEVLTIPGSVKVYNGGIYGMTKLVLGEGIERIDALIDAEEVVFPSTLKSAGPNTSRSTPSEYDNPDEYETRYEGCLYIGDAINPYLILVGASSFEGVLKIHPDTKIIADEAFYGYVRATITGIEFNDKLEYIGEKAFYRASISCAVNIPDSVKGIGNYAFYNEFDRQNESFSITLGAGIEEIGDAIVSSENYRHYNYYGNTCYLGTAENPYLVLDDHQGNANSTFKIHADTKFILTYPAGINIVYDGTSAQWGNIYKVDYFFERFNEYWDDPKIVCSDGVVDPYGATYGLSFTKSSKYDDAYAVAKGSATGDIVIPAIYKGLPVVEIRDWGFGSTDITSVALPDSIRRIGQAAFSGSSITEIVIPDSVEIIAENAFSDCKSLASVTLGKGVKRIEAFALDSTAITSLTLPEGIEYINSYAIERCESLTLNEYDNAYYLGSADNPYFALVRIKDAGKSTCEIHADTVMILDSVFKNSAISSIVIPDGVRSLGDNAFQGCTSLVDITLGKGITIIEDYTFQSCSALITVVFLGEVTEIGDGAFQYCEELSEFVFPESLEVIGSMAFQQCSKLVVALGNNITSIGIRVFEYCFVDREDGIDQITYAGTVDEWNEIGLSESWYYSSGATKVVCVDGEISLLDE